MAITESNMNKEQQTTNEVNAAVDWILRSGIQNTEGKNAGGFNAWLDLTSGEYSFVYSEITGYGITTLLFLEKRFNDRECLLRAIKAADWLIDCAAHPSGGVRTRDYYAKMQEGEHYSFENENIYAFDNGMVLYGMVNLYERTKEKRYLEFAKSLARFLMESMIKEDGSCYAIFNVKSGEKMDIPWKWSSQSGSYHAKLALPFLDIYDITAEDAYKKTALALSRESLAFQEAAGRFVTSRLDKSTHLHPHLYSAEGVLYAGLHSGDDILINSARKAIEWAFSAQGSDGGVPKFYNDSGFVSHYRSDILAQALRLGSILYASGRLDGAYAAKLTALKDKLLEFQYAEENAQQGGFLYGWTIDGEKKANINSWCTMFAVQALIVYEDMVVRGKKVGRLEQFV